jgi:integrase
VDFERGLIFLPDSQSGRKTVTLNGPAIEVLTGLERAGPFVVASDDPQKPRADLKRPWEAVAKRAGLRGVRLHDLRHTYASFGAGGGFGLPIIGKLLGHTQTNNHTALCTPGCGPPSAASDAIGGRIAAALEGKRGKVFASRR